MDHVYDDYYHQAHDLHNHFEDRIDSHTHPQAQVLQHELRQISEDFQRKRDPQYMDDKLKRIDHELEQAKHQPNPVMDRQDLEDLQHRYRRLREGFRSASSRF